MFTIEEHFTDRAENEYCHGCGHYHSCACYVDDDSRIIYWFNFNSDSDSDSDSYYNDMPMYFDDDEW